MQDRSGNWGHGYLCTDHTGGPVHPRHILSLAFMLAIDRAERGGENGDVKGSRCN